MEKTKTEPSLATFKTTRTVGGGGGNASYAASYSYPTSTPTQPQPVPEPGETSMAATDSRKATYDLYS